MSDGSLLAVGCGVFFIFLSGVYAFLRSELQPRESDTPVLDPSDAQTDASRSAA